MYKRQALTYIDIKADKITLCLWFQRDSVGFVDMLIDAYVAVAERNELRVAIHSLAPEEDYDRKLRDDEFWIAKPRKDPKTNEYRPEPGITTFVGRTLENLAGVAKEAKRDGVVGFALRFRGSLATPLLEAEVGRHELQRTNLLSKCLIEKTGDTVDSVLLNIEDVDWNNSKKIPRVRLWNERKSRVEAKDLRGEGLVWAKSKTADCLAKILKERLLKQAEKLIE